MALLTATDISFAASVRLDQFTLSCNHLTVLSRVIFPPRPQRPTADG
jgi:hypothetical protein